MKEVIFEYKQALKSKVGKKVDGKIWDLELMELYGISYKELMETPFEIYELMKQKLIIDRNSKKIKK